MNSTGSRIGRSIFYSVWAVLMTALTYVLGGVSLKVLRRKLDRSLYWLLGTAISCALYLTPAKYLGLAFFSLVMLIGVFSELEDLDFGFLTSAFFTLLINGLLGSGAFALWVWHVGSKWSQTLTTYMEEAFKPVVELNAGLQINYYDLMLQLPSIVIILWMIALYLSVLLERRLMGSEASIYLEGRHSMRPQLSEVRMPDPVVWVFIAALLGALGGFQIHWLEALSVNALNVCCVLFFFQGVAVVARFFESLRMGFFWQFVFMALIVVHLFLFVALLGLLDYWVDFRVRIKRTEEFNRET